MKNVRYKDTEREFEMANSTLEKIIEHGEMSTLFGKPKKSNWFSSVFNYFRTFLLFQKVKDFFDP